MIDKIENILIQRLENILNSRELLGSSNCKQEQKHLDAGSPERDYWHYGYETALKDVLNLLKHDGSC